MVHRAYTHRAQKRQLSPIYGPTAPNPNPALAVDSLEIFLEEWGSQSQGVVLR